MMVSYCIQWSYIHYIWVYMVYSGYMHLPSKVSVLGLKLSWKKFIHILVWLSAKFGFHVFEHVKRNPRLVASQMRREITWHSGFKCPHLGEVLGVESACFSFSNHHAV